MTQLAKYGLKIATTHPQLNWLTAQQRSRTIPQQAAKKLAGITDLDSAQSFLQHAGLEVLSHIKRISSSVVSVSIAPPKGFDEYYGPQIIFAQIESVEIPRASVLMNCLLPKPASEAEGEKAFNYFQRALLTLADKLEALPFACITGFKTEHPQHDLFQRGFRFFFSSASDQFYPRLRILLEAQEKIFNSTDREAARRAAEALQHLKFVATDTSSVGHSILEDIQLMTPETVLIDLR